MTPQTNPTSNDRVRFSRLSLTASITFLVFALGVLLVALATQTTKEESNSGDTPAAQTSSGTSGSGISVIDPPQPLTNFEFISDEGQPLALSDLSGRYVLMAFGYTNCPDVCPDNLLKFRQIKADLGAASDDVAFVFVSVDPQRDTAPFLDRYLARFDPTFIGLVGEHSTLEAIASEYNLFWEIHDDGERANYLVDHTASRYLVDPDGDLVRIYSFTASVSDITADLQALVLES